MHDIIVTADYSWLSSVWYGFCIIWGCSILADAMCDIRDEMRATNRILKDDE